MIAREDLSGADRERLEDLDVGIEQAVRMLEEEGALLHLPSQGACVLPAHPESHTDHPGVPWQPHSDRGLAVLIGHDDDLGLLGGRVDRVFGVRAQRFQHVLDRLPDLRVVITGSAVLHS